MNPLIYLFDDAVSQSWDPFILTRPGGELAFGAFLFRERAERFWAAPCSGHITHDSLGGFTEPGSAQVVDVSGRAADLPTQPVSSLGDCTQSPDGPINPLSRRIGGGLGHPTWGPKP
jgi:hypothetical protein